MAVTVTKEQLLYWKSEGTDIEGIVLVKFREEAWLLEEQNKVWRIWMGAGLLIEGILQVSVF